MESNFIANYKRSDICELLKNRKIFVQRKYKKSDFVVKGFINDITKLEYFFEKFFEFRNNSQIPIFREMERKYRYRIARKSN